MDCLTILDADNSQMINTTVMIGSTTVNFIEPLINISRTPNQHDKIQLKGKVSCEDYEETIIKLVPDTEIQIKYGLVKEQLLLFYGIVTAIDVISYPAEYHPIYNISIEGMSYSCLLERKKRSRAYQDPQITNRQLLQDVIGKYPDPNYIMIPELSETILGKFTVQYNETDWDFLKRLASRTGYPLVASSVSKGVKIKFGVTWGASTYELGNNYLYRTRELKEISSPDKHSFLGKCMEQYAVEIMTEGPDAQSLEIGDCIIFQNRLWFVKQVNAYIKNHTLTHKYILTGKYGFFTEEICNFQIKGVSLKGAVAEVNKNLVKIQLDIDTYPENNNCWFPYSTFYSTFYCMPEKGDRINLYFPNCEEDQAIVLNSIHAPLEASGNPAAQELFSNDKVKTLATKGGKMLILDDQMGKVSLVCGNGSYITITGDTISISTSNQIEIKAGSNLILSADESIELSADTEIKLSCKESMISVTQASIDINAVDIKMNEG